VDLTVSQEKLMTTSSYESLSHSKWDCKYHVVFIPKCRRKELYGKIRKYLGPVFHELAKQRGGKILEGHMVQDHVHMLIKIPSKYAVAEVIGYMKGKSAIAVARQFGGRKKNFNGEKFWARGYAVYQITLIYLSCKVSSHMLVILMKTILNFYSLFVAHS
jgi:putative transposase